MEFFRDMVGKATKQSPAIAAALENPSKSGIDLTGKIYMTTDIDKNDPESITNHILVPLANASNFEKLVKAADIEFETQNGLNVYVSGKRNDAIMMWDDKLMTLSFANSSDINVQSKARELFVLEGEQSLASNKDFAKAVKTDHDMVYLDVYQYSSRKPCGGYGFKHD